MADIYDRYKTVEAQLADVQRKRAEEKAAAQARLQSGESTALAEAGRGIASMVLPSGLRRQESRLRQQLTDMRPELDMQNARLQGANAAIAASAQGANQRAAITEQVQQTESQEGTADLLVPDEGDTATPGGASGRRRRKATEVGSIRI